MEMLELLKEKPSGKWQSVYDWLAGLPDGWLSSAMWLFAPVYLETLFDTLEGAVRHVISQIDSPDEKRVWLVLMERILQADSLPAYYETLDMSRGACDA